MPHQPALQLRTLTLYGELLCRHQNWAHKLTLAAFEGASDSGLAAASTLAGAASLTIDPDTALVKEHFRDGAFDFVVNTLDEALRTIKNEIRQGRPIAIALIAPPAHTLAEATARGLKPDFLVSSQAERPSPQLTSWLAQHDWQPAELPSSITFEDKPRHNWLTQLLTLQRSARTQPRYGWLTPPR